MSETSKSSVDKVQQALQAYGLSCQVIELPDSTRSAIEAAQAIGCQVAQIAKSLIFVGSQSGQPILIVASGANRVDEERVAQLIGEPIVKANATFVREHTGFAIGGVPPIAHSQQLRTLIDQDLLQYPEIWAAAGTPHAVFRIAPEDLARAIGGTIVSIKK